MYQITLKTKEGRKIKSLYPTKEQAAAAATQLRLISTRWKKSIRSKDCERKNAKPLVWNLHGYTVEPPVQV